MRCRQTVRLCENGDFIIKNGGLFKRDFHFRNVMRQPEIVRHAFRRPDRINGIVDMLVQIDFFITDGKADFRFGQFGKNDRRKFRVDHAFGMQLIVRQVLGRTDRPFGVQIDQRPLAGRAEQPFAFFIDGFEITDAADGRSVTGPGR